MWHLGGEFAIITAAACKGVRDAPQGGAAGLEALLNGNSDTFYCCACTLYKIDQTF